MMEIDDYSYLATERFFFGGVVSEISVVSDSNIASYRLKISLYLISSRPSLSKCHVDT